MDLLRIKVKIAEGAALKSVSISVLSINK
jgi:hypothetical protein